MVQVGRFVKNWFAIQTVALFYLALLFLSPFLHRIGPAIRYHHISHLFLWSAFKFVASLASGLIVGRAWLTLDAGRPSARKWATVACWLNLPLFGVGTTIGIVGLMAFAKPRVLASVSGPAKDRSRKPLPAAPQPLPGDGTSKHRGPWVSVIFVLAMFFGSALWFRWAFHQKHLHLNFVIMAVGWWPALLVGTVAHELGHLFGGFAGGMRAYVFEIGPLAWSRILDGRWHCRFNAKGLLGGGRTGMIPMNFRNFQSKRIVMLASGPAASLLVGIACTTAALNAAQKPWEWLWPFLAYSSVLGITLFVINLIPLQVTSAYSDGAQIYQTLQGGKWLDLHLALAMSASTLVSKNRPKDLDIQVLNRAGAFVGTGNLGFVLRHIRLEYYQDTGRIAEMLEVLEEAEHAYPEAAKFLTADHHADFVFVHALYRRDAAAARVWWERMEARPPAKSMRAYWKARAALDWIEGRLDEARSAWEQGQKIVEKSAAAGAYEYERECFELIRRAIDSGTVAIETVRAPGHQQIFQTS